MHWLHLSRRFATWAVVILAVAFAPSLPPASAADYSVPVVAKVTATVPLNPDLHNLCLVRSDTSGSPVDQRFICYATAAPGDPPPPPPPPYQAAMHQVLVSDFSPATGLLTVPLLPCLEFLPGYLALKVDLLIPLDKAGGEVGPGNYVVLIQDTDAPCTNGTVRLGPLTLTPLAEDHNEDSAESLAVFGHPDPCTDFQELGSTEGLGGLRDPWNPYDFYDLNGDKIITVFDEIIEVANAFGPVGQDDPRDRGPKVPGGPHDWNRSKGDKVVTVFDDILVVAGQFGHDCR